VKRGKEGMGGEGALYVGFCPGNSLQKPYLDGSIMSCESGLYNHTVQNTQFSSSGKVTYSLGVELRFKLCTWEELGGGSFRALVFVDLRRHLEEQ
jgi:hypothetical protein